jgi:hypothetical protein
MARKPAEKKAKKAPKKAAKKTAKKTARKPARTPQSKPAPRLDPAVLVDRLEHDAEVFRNLLSGVGPEQARWRPAPGKWSLLEVTCHLRDEEREDFRARIKRTLLEPGREWAPIDPAGWVAERDYEREDLLEILMDFVEERARSVGWLRGIGRVDWNLAYEHPKLGPIRLGDLLVSWVAHDCLHLRQIARLHYLYAREVAGGFKTDYAGDW